MYDVEYQLPAQEQEVVGNTDVYLKPITNNL